MRYQAILLAGVLLGAAAGAQAQSTPAAGAAASTAGKSSSGPEGNSNVGNQANYATLAEHQRGGLSFTGNVRVENAPMPWDPIPVVVTCNGVVRYRTDADAKGAFVIQGQVTPSELVPTRGNAKEASAAQLIGCDIKAALPGFASTTLHIANQDIMDNPYLGTLVIHPDELAGASAGTSAPVSKDAQKRFDKARAEWQHGNVDGAQHDLEKVVKIDPQFADAWYQLGKLEEAKNDNQAALNSYQKAVAADPKFFAPYERIAEIAAPQKKWQDVANATAQALKLDPAGTPQLWYYDAVAKLNLGHADAAEASARKSLAMDPQHLAPNTEQLLAVILAGKGEYAEALKHLQNSLTYMKPGPNADMVKQQIAQLEKVVPASQR